MEQILWEFLPRLFVAVILNTLLGMYNNIGIRKMHFSFKILFKGLLKASLFCICLIGLSYILEAYADSYTSVTPENLLETGTLYYAGKIALSLKDMLFIDEEKASNSH